ncbi:MAG TPA: APC family permease, partial [Myxococcales bacterium]|nr:APC family permease [Myxococcales bacterium]
MMLMASTQNGSKARKLTPIATLIAAISGMVGSGWLLGPFHAASIAGPASILSWLIGGLLMLVIAYTFVMLVRIAPLSGGSIRFLQLSHGHFAGFTFSWIAWIAWIAVTPIEVMAVIQYCNIYFPSLMQQQQGIAVLSHTGLEMAIVLMVVMYFINIKGIQVLSRANYLMVVLKLCVPLATFFILITQHFSFSNFSGQHGFAPMGYAAVLAALPTAGVIYSFVGFNPAIQLASEIKNPGRTIPFAVFGAILICIVLYTGLQIAFIGALPSASFAEGWQHLHFHGDTGPFAGLVMAFGFSWFVKLLYADAVVSPLGTAMVQAAATGRMTYAMAQSGYLPKSLQALNPKQSPSLALSFNVLIGLLFFLPFPSWQKMVGFLVSCLVLGYVVGPISLLTLSRA